MFNCPKGCQSIDADYCSVCGAKIANAVPPVSALPQAVPAAPPKTVQESCPDCGAPRTSKEAVFCELCRYNFVSRRSSPGTPDLLQSINGNGNVQLSISGAAVENVLAATSPVAQASLPAFSPPLSAALQAPQKAALVRLEATVNVDPSMFVEEPGITCPVGQPERVFHLDLAEILIGRRSDTKDIHPEIPVNDDTAISHRHAKLLRQADGHFVIMDVGSANGTTLNGTDLSAGIRAPLKPSDEIRLGRWTLIKIRAI